MLIETVLVLPISSAICERGFSAVKRIKSDWRSNLRTETMNHLLLAMNKIVKTYYWQSVFV
jgi:hypothetical protein